MPPEGVGSLQALAAVASLALWISKVDNTPGEVSRCLELVQVIYRDTQYLVELRGENLSALLKEPPRELRRIDDVVATATASINEIGRLLEKHRLEVQDGRPGIKGGIVWAYSDSESFSRWTPSLQVQHASVLSEIGHLKTFALMHPVLRMAGRVERSEKERSFENVNLLQSLLSGGNKSKDQQGGKSCSLLDPRFGRWYRTYISLCVCTYG